MALSNEWAGQGVQVNAIAPGYIATDNTQALQDDPDRSQEIFSPNPAGTSGNAIVTFLLPVVMGSGRTP